MRKKQVLIEECKKHLRDSKKYEHEYKKDIRKLITELEKQLTLNDVVKSLPIVCKNYINGQCTECELNEHKECNG
tara:strand:+ start:61 stop:285 length:225 start_codon:yes stop_codon:yes gene_type:complete